MNNLRPHRTLEEWLVALGHSVKALRLDRDLDQATLAARSGVSLRALKNLEYGTGATVRTLVQVLRALDREQWLESLAPVATINPLTLGRAGSARHRASPRRADGTRTRHGKNSK